MFKFGQGLFFFFLIARRNASTDRVLMLYNINLPTILNKQLVSIFGLQANVTTLHLRSNSLEVTQQSWFYLDNLNITASYLITVFSFNHYL